MIELEEVFHKNTKSSHKWTGYFEIYQRHLNRFRNKDIQLIEVGVQKGGSLEMWGNFFGPQAKITGIDVDKECAKLVYDNPNINVIIGSQGDPAFWDETLTKFDQINVFIDDGSHICDHQILTFEKVFPLMPLGSVFVCEDCHTSYQSSHGGALGRETNFIEYSKHFADVLNQSWLNTSNEELDRKIKLSEGLSGLFFYDSVVVFEKFGKRGMDHVFPNGLPRD